MYPSPYNEHGNHTTACGTHLVCTVCSKCYTVLKYNMLITRKSDIARLIIAFQWPTFLWCLWNSVTSQHKYILCLDVCGKNLLLRTEAPAVLGRDCRRFLVIRGGGWGLAARTYTHIHTQRNKDKQATTTLHITALHYFPKPHRFFIPLTLCHLLWKFNFHHLLISAALKKICHQMKN